MKHPVARQLLIATASAIVAASVGCDSSGPSNPSPTVPIVDGGFATDLETVVDFLGFEPILPTYIPPALELDRRPEVLVADGEPYGVLIGYWANPTPGVPPVIKTVVVEEQILDPPSDFGLGSEAILLDSQTVFIREKAGSILVEWIMNDLMLRVLLFGADQNGRQAQLRPEAIRLVRSMIE